MQLCVCELGAACVSVSWNSRISGALADMSEKWVSGGMEPEVTDRESTVLITEAAVFIVIHCT